jgi:hypothetical protein
MGFSYLDLIEMKWLSASWTQSSGAGSRLAVDERAGFVISWLNARELKWF